MRYIEWYLYAKYIVGVARLCRLSINCIVHSHAYTFPLQRLTPIQLSSAAYKKLYTDNLAVFLGRVAFILFTISV
jgi:hypothetical protein